jgi:hypothetical protein
MIRPLTLKAIRGIPFIYELQLFENGDLPENISDYTPKMKIRAGDGTLLDEPFCELIDAVSGKIRVISNNTSTFPKICYFDLLLDSSILDKLVVATGGVILTDDYISR